MASRLTASPINDTVPKMANPAGASANITANCIRISHPSRLVGELASPTTAPNISNTPTAANDNQNPAARGAAGSSSSTVINATDHSRPAPTCRQSSRAATYTASMSQVRCVGTENPASHE
jgi:hypothetical protein